MTKKKKKNQNKKKKTYLTYEISGIFIIALGIFSLVCLFRPEVGSAGKLIEQSLKLLTGEGRYLIGLVLSGIGIKLVKDGNTFSFFNTRIYGICILLLAILSFLHIKLPLQESFHLAMEGMGGGIIGAGISYILKVSFGEIGSYIFIFTGGLTGLLLLTKKSLLSVINLISRTSVSTVKTTANSLVNFLYTEEKVKSDKGSDAKEDFSTNSDDTPVIDYVEVTADNLQAINGINEYDQQDTGDTSPVNPVSSINLALENEEEQFNVNNADTRDFRLPPVTLLNRQAHSKNTRANQEINSNIRILEETLESFGIKAKVTQVARGPAITRYELQPPPGIKVSRIVGLADNIALTMAAPDVRIEAPIPGKAAVGIEVPNKEITSVPLSDLIETSEFSQASSKLTVALGKDIAGTPVFADLGKMPHLLIAGSTGSGKSVCLNSLIVSVLFKATPDEVKLLMIDPKMVELNNYNGIPHLISPVIIDAKKAATSLRWAVKEMENRYKLFAEAGVRDITRYNEYIRHNNKGNKDTEEKQKQLPLILVIIDELADLMMVAPHDVEDAICRLAQMARAAGMHLVVATQRPSVDVITGLIKANIPSRISFAVSSQTDSRTILDMGGAEKLLGKGDMLFYPVGASKPKRIQGVFLSDQEVEKVVDFLKEQAQPVYNDKVIEESSTPEEKTVREEDELLPEAVRILIENGNASISMLQRRLHIGYARAARLIDIMEQRGIVGGYEGSKPRTVLMTLDQYYQTFGTN
ncbi:DNA translocase FtsK [Desulfolucanica intricata]|uniref:DNA translocase FtsK n=1 Tax=Desulfolucanica intricata TaxID=1285191 RepID=UPI000836D10A|nr:DNA translocase FtsK [Desulfolucanica intricata]